MEGLKAFSAWKVVLGFCRPLGPGLGLRKGLWGLSGGRGRLEGLYGQVRVILMASGAGLLEQSSGEARWGRGGGKEVDRSAEMVRGRSERTSLVGSGRGLGAGDCPYGSRMGEEWTWVAGGDGR